MVYNQSISGSWVNFRSIIRSTAVETQLAVYIVWHCTSSISITVRPGLESVNGVTDIHGQVDRFDFLIAVEIIEADG